MKRRSVLVVMGLLFAGACATVPANVVVGGRRPAWVDNPQTKYPLRYYVSAIGEGDTLSDAQNVAAGNLAKIFRSDIDVEENLEERYLEFIGKKNSYQEKTRFNRNVRIGSKMSLFNIQYSESYRDATGRIYALAYIDRQQTAGIYKTRLKENDAKVAEFVKRAEGAQPAMQYAALSAAVAVGNASRVMLEQLDVIAPKVKAGIKQAYSYEELSKRLAEAAAKLRFSVSITDDGSGKIKSAVEEMMTGMGFVVDAEGALKVVGKVRFENTDLKRGNLSFVRYEAVFSIVNAAGKTVVSVSQRGREGHVSQKEAQARCVRSVVGVVDGKLRSQLQAWFDGLVKR
jgi:hypothetical protein